MFVRSCTKKRSLLNLRTWCVAWCNYYMLSIGNCTWLDFTVWIKNSNNKMYLLNYAYWKHMRVALRNHQDCWLYGLCVSMWLFPEKNFILYNAKKQPRMIGKNHTRILLYLAPCYGATVLAHYIWSMLIVLHILYCRIVGNKVLSMKFYIWLCEFYRAARYFFTNRSIEGPFRITPSARDPTRSAPERM